MYQYTSDQSQLCSSNGEREKEYGTHGPGLTDRDTHATHVKHTIGLYAYTTITRDRLFDTPL